MPWHALPHIAFGVAIHPFVPTEPADLPLQLGDELYIIEEGGTTGEWYRGYLVAPPSLLAGLTSVKGQTLEARVFSGVFPANCIEIREILSDEIDTQSGALGQPINGPSEPHKGPKKGDGSGVFELDGSVPVSPAQAQGHVYELYGDMGRHPHPISHQSVVIRSNGVASKSDLLKRMSIRRSTSQRQAQARSRTSRGSQESVRSVGSHVPVSEAESAQLKQQSTWDNQRLKPMAPVPMLKIGSESSSMTKEPLVDEIASCLREWHSSSIHELLLSRQYLTLSTLNELVVQLDFVRKQLLNELLTEQEAITVRTRAVWLLVQGNKLLGREVLVRDPSVRGRLLTSDDPAIDVFKLQFTMSLLDTQPHEDWEDALNEGKDIQSPVAGSSSASISSRDRSGSTPDARPDNEILRGILKWRDKTPPELKELLHRFPYIPEPQLARVCGDVLDSIFGILVERSGHSDYEDLAFEALVTVLGLVHDRRFSLNSVVDEYISSRFNHPFTTPVLLRALSRLLADPGSSDHSRKLRAVLKVGSRVFRFILYARQQQKEKEAGIGITSLQPSFGRDLRNIFRSFDALMESQDPRLIGTQTLAVQHFYSWLIELPMILPVPEIMEIATAFVNSCTEVKGKLVLFKLALIGKLSISPLFEQPEHRKILRSSNLKWLAPYLEPPRPPITYSTWREQVRLCLGAISAQIDQPDEMASACVAYLPPLVLTFLYLRRHVDLSANKESVSILFPKHYPLVTRPCSSTSHLDEALIEVSAILAALSKAAALPVDLILLWDFSFVMQLLEVFQSILAYESFPASWLSVNIYQHRSILRFLELLLEPLIKAHLPEPEEADNFNTDLWQAYLKCLLKVVGSRHLALETFADQKRRAVWVIGGDIREQGAVLLRRTWAAIGWDTSPTDQRLYGYDKMGGYQVQYVPSLVGEIVELCLSPHEGLRTTAVGILQTMLISEWTLDQDLSTIQAEITAALNQFFRVRSDSDNVYHKSFITELLDRFDKLSAIPDDLLYPAVRSLALVIDELLDLLTAVHAIELGGEAYQGVHTLRLMEFLKGMQKEDIFIQYVHQLSHNLAKQGHVVEAGLALQLHAELYDWDTTIMATPLTDPSFPEQSHFDRKEIIYLEMIRLFEDGKSWENEMVAYRELAQQYEANTFDLFKLAKTQKAMAKIFESVAKGNRHSPRYFRVVFTGLGFPIGLRGKAFVLQGHSHEKLATFVEKLQEQYPAAKITSTAEHPEMEGQFLEVSAVAPFHDYHHPVYQKPKVAVGTRAYLSWPRRNVFAAVARRADIPKIDSRDPRPTSVDQVLYLTNESFPNILQKSEILEKTVIQLPLLHLAIERTIRKTQELITLHRRVADGRAELLSSLTTFLLSSVDLTIEKSVAAYRSLLPPEILDANNLPHEDEAGPPNDAAGSQEKAAGTATLQLALKVGLMDHAAECYRAFAVYRGRDQAKELLVDLQEKWELSYAPDLASLPDENKSAGPALAPKRAVSRSLGSSRSNRPRT